MHAIGAVSCVLHACTLYTAQLWMLHWKNKYTSENMQGITHFIGNNHALKTLAEAPGNTSSFISSEPPPHAAVRSALGQRRLIG